MALTDKLTNIANAIREKGGTTEKLTLDAMPNAIAALSTGGGEDPVPNPIVYTSDCFSVFANENNSWILETLADRIETINITNASNMFKNTKTVDSIPFVINLSDNDEATCDYMFEGSAIALTENNLSGMNGKIKSAIYMFKNYKQSTLPAITGSITNGYPYNYMFSGSLLESIGKITIRPTQMRMMFDSCYYLKNAPEMEINHTSIDTANYSHMTGIYGNCYSLRTVPENTLKQLYSIKNNNAYTALNSIFYCCYTLDEIVGLNPQSANMNSNAFANSFTNCYRVKNIIFATQEDGTPYTANWKNQTIDLTQYVGWAGAANADKDIVNYNSGITAEDEDNDWSNNPNYWSRQFMNSRFNHDSAVNLINSLPDTSAYLATQSGATNTVKFYTNAGSATPGGGVNALTEEEIAVATAKGWTITYGV